MEVVKQTRVSLKGMTDEEKKARKAQQMKEYMAKRRQEDPVFAEKQREYNRARKNLRYNTDEEYREKTKEQNRNLAREYKKKYEELMKNIEKL